MTSTLGALAALGSSFTWAFASARYARVSREIGSVRVNLARALVVAPIYSIVALGIDPHALSRITTEKAGWLALSVLCSYGLADILFFTSARILGISSALAIASIYPLWSALSGALFGGEPFGLVRVAGVALCTGGVIALVRMQSKTTDDKSGSGSLVLGLVLALATSFLWAGNTFSVKRGSVDLNVMEANAVRYTVALVLLAAGSLLQRNKNQYAAAPAAGWTRALLLAILADCLLGSILFVYGLGNTDLAIGATLSSLAPLVSVPIAVALGDERWSAKRAAAVTVTVAGAVLLVTSAG